MSCPTKPNHQGPPAVLEGLGDFVKMEQAYTLYIAKEPFMERSSSGT